MNDQRFKFVLWLWGNNEKGICTRIVSSWMQGLYFPIIKKQNWNNPVSLMLYKVMFCLKEWFLIQIILKQQINTNKKTKMISLII